MKQGYAAPSGAPYVISFYSKGMHQTEFQTTQIIGESHSLCPEGVHLRLTFQKLVKSLTNKLLVKVIY